MKNIILLFILAISINTIGQRNEIAWNKAKEAIKLMDDGKIDESILLLEECQKIDNTDYTYPYEIAFAYIKKKDYENAIKILETTKKYKNVNSQIYQMSGNCYSYLGNSESAIKEYEEGMKKFPNAGNLHLEKGNIFLDKEKYNEAILNYENGIKVDPMFASNYYRLALLYLNSNDKLSGIIYGEIFMNLERTTKRTTEISKLLYETYKKSIIFNGNETKIEFCEVILDARNVKNNDIEMPFCGVFGSNFILSIMNQIEINLQTLSEIRTEFINNYFKKDFAKYPNVLFEYHKLMLDKNIFDSYNKYIFQLGAQTEFADWKEKNKVDYDKFVDWYTTKTNYLIVNDKNRFIKE